MITPSKSSLRFFSCLVMTLLMANGCSYRKEKVIPGQGSDSERFRGILDFKSLSYEDIRSAIIAPKCLSCHSQAGTVNLSSFESVKNGLAAIERVAIHEMTMPPGRPLDPAERELLAAWIESGAPETATPVSNPPPRPTPVPTPAPLEPTFASLKANIFDKKCLSCHFSPGPIKDITFDRQEDLINSPRDVVLPGNSEESGLYISVSRLDNKRMPPPVSGLAPLTSEEIEIIKIWIDEKL